MKNKLTLKIFTISISFFIFILVGSETTYAAFDINTICTHTRTLFSKTFCPTAQRNSGGFYDGSVVIGGWKVVNLNNAPITRGKLTLFSPKTHCGDSSYGGGAFLSVSVNGGQKYLYSICGNSGSVVSYIDNGSDLMRLITPLEVQYGDVVSFTLTTSVWNSNPTGCFKIKREKCELIGVMPGWVPYDLSEDSRLNIFFNNNKQFDGKSIYELATVRYGDFNLDANIGGGDYYDFNDQVLTLALTETEEPPPACDPDDVAMSTNPIPAFIGGNISINAVNKAYAGSKQLSFTGITNPPCSKTATSPDLKASYGISNCTVNKDPGTYTWTIHYQLFNKTGTGKSNQCSKSMEYEIIERPGYLITSGGDTYMFEGFNMPSYNYYAKPYCEKATGKTYCMSENFFAYKTFSYQGVVPCPNCSTNKYNRTDYTDRNDAYLNFDTLRETTISRASLYDIEVSKLPLHSATNPVKTRIFDIGSYTIPAGQKCNNPDIFLVRGDLIITPDFVINNYVNDSAKSLGCLFIVDGNVIILPGALKGLNKYETIHGFFILTGDESKIITNEDQNDLIKIVGGVVSNNGIQNMMKRKAKRIDGFAPPSEYIVYEGSRYISIFGNLFVDGDLTYNIYEGPFINTFTQ
jgi:hypothetical protein